MPRSSMRWCRRASASRRALDSNSSSVWVGVSKGRRVKGEVAQVHHVFSWSLSRRIASGEGEGWGAGSSGSAFQEGRSRLTVVLA